MKNINFEGKKLSYKIGFNTRTWLLVKLAIDLYGRLLLKLAHNSIIKSSWALIVNLRKSQYGLFQR